MISTSYEKYITDASTPKSGNIKLAAWLCSTTFIVSPVLADAFDFKLEHNPEGSILHVERFDNKHLRSNSPDEMPRKASFKLSDYLQKAPIQHDGLTIKLEKVEINNEQKICIKLFRGREFLGSLNVNDDGTVHVSTQATSDHLFITSTKDIYLDGHVTKGTHDCNITLQTGANVYLDGIINVQNLHVVANQIISRDSTELDAKNIRFKAKQLTTSGKYKCACVDVDVENDWGNKANFVITDTLSIIRAHALRNHRKIETGRFTVQRLSHFDNSSISGNQSLFTVSEYVNWTGLTSFLNKGNVIFYHGVDIQASDLIATGKMTVVRGAVNLAAKEIKVEALATDGKEGVVKLTADTISSKQLLALSRKVIFNVKEKAVLNGTHSAGIFGFIGREFENTGHLVASDTIAFSELQTFTHKSGEMTAFIIKGTVTHFENHGLINVTLPPEYVQV